MSQVVFAAVGLEPQLGSDSPCSVIARLLGRKPLSCGECCKLAALSAAFRGLAKKRFNRLAGMAASISLGASVYRRMARRRHSSGPARFVVRARVDHRLVSDLGDFIRALQGRAILEGEELSVPLAEGVSEADVYRDLRAALDRWEIQHPGIRTSIRDGNAEARH